MSDSATTVDLAMRIMEKGMVRFTDFKPRMDGYQSNIASVMGCDISQTDALLRQADALEDDQHFLVEPVLIRSEATGSKGETIPAQYRVTITPQ